jgi:hypothetical protein
MLGMMSELRIGYRSKMPNKKNIILTECHSITKKTTTISAEMAFANKLRRNPQKVKEIAK